MQADAKVAIDKTYDYRITGEILAAHRARVNAAATQARMRAAATTRTAAATGREQEAGARVAAGAGAEGVVGGLTRQGAPQLAPRTVKVEGRAIRQSSPVPAVGRYSSPVQFQQAIRQWGRQLARASLQPHPGSR